ncbi:fimbrial protein [Burkholderia sp. MR1-5-21]
MKAYISMPASLTVDASVPDGTVLWSHLAQPESLGRINVRCEYYPFQGWRRMMGVKANYSAYETSVPGIGVRLKGLGNTIIYWPVGGPNEIQGKDNWWPDRWEKTTGLLVELVKIGPIYGTGTLSGLVATHTYVGDIKEKVIAELWFDDVSIGPRRPSCAVSTKSVTVPLGNVPIRKLNSVGATSDEKSFNVSIQCTGGLSGATVKAHMTMTDATNTSNRTNVLSLTKDSTATGVGIQIKRTSENVLVNYGADSSAVGNVNQWEVGSLGNGVVTIPFSAHYIRTSSDIGVGSANGKATFTMSFN